jgi:regulatory protein
MPWKKPSKTKEPENLEKAYDYAVFLLSLQLRTVGEVLRKMQQRGYSEKVITDVVERLKDQKYLDDGRYAEIFLENLKAYRNFGFYGIKKKMMEKKLPKELIERVLEAGLSNEDELEIGERLLAKEKFKVKKRSADEEQITYSSYGEGNSPEQKAKQKMANRLKSRGFRGEVIAKLLF